MIKFRKIQSLLTSIKSNLLISRNVVPYKIQDSWDDEFRKQNTRLDYLQKLLETNKIRSYFDSKEIKQYERSDIYFYMSNKELFYKIQQDTKEELIKNTNTDCIFKFRLALDFRTIESEEVQKQLISSFNTSFKDLASSDIIFCLELIESFQEAAKNINFPQLQKKLIAEQNPKAFISFAYLMSRFGCRIQTMENVLIQEKVSMLDSYELKTIYHIKAVCKFFKIQMTEICENSLRQTFLQKSKLFEVDEGLFIVKLIDFYPQSANFINLECMNAESYIAYLQVFIESDSRPINQAIPKILSHSIPSSILANADPGNLQTIIKHRIKLQLDNLNKLTNQIKQYYTPNLNFIFALIQYLEKEQKITPKQESLLENSLLSKIIKKQTKAFEEYELVNVVKIFGFLSLKNLGTSSFWMKVSKFLVLVFQDKQNYKNLQSYKQKKFVIYIFQIFKNRAFPNQLENQIIKLTLLSLTINKWSLKQISRLAICLTANRIADNELWFGIEFRIKKINLKNLQTLEDRKFLKILVRNFNIIGKGSYEFWRLIDKNLSKKQKVQILSGFQRSKSFAHTYLKI